MLRVDQLPESLFQRLGITRRGGYQPLLSDYVVPVVSIPIASSNPIDEATDSGAVFYSESFKVANGAQPSKLQLLNPAGSGVVAYVDWVAAHCISLGAGAVALLHLREGVDAPFPNLNAQQGRNALLGGAGPALQIRDDHAANTGNVISSAQIWQGAGVHPAPLKRESQHSIRLDPGKALVVNTGAINLSLVAMWNWREYPAGS